MDKQLSSVDSAKQNIDAAFIDINTMTEKAAVVTENTEQMAGAADHGAELMNNTMDKMNSIEQSVANSAAAEQQSASSEEIASASHSLADLATELQAATGKFKI